MYIVHVCLRTHVRRHTYMIHTSMFCLFPAPYKYYRGLQFVILHHVYARTTRIDNLHIFRRRLKMCYKYLTRAKILKT